MKAIHVGTLSRISIVVMLAAIAVLTACQQQPAAPAATPTSPAPPKKEAATPAPKEAATPSPMPAASPTQAALAPIKVKASWCAVAGSMFPLWVGKDAGIFQKHGLDLEVVFIQGDSQNVAALGQNEVQFVECASSAVLKGAVQGADVVAIDQIYKGLPYRLVVHPSIKTVSDLKGKKLAVNKPGDMDDLINRVMLKRFGFEPNKDVTLVPLGGQTARLEGLIGGKVDGTTVNPPVNVSARNQGFPEIFDLNDLNMPFIYVSMHTSKKFITSNPDAVERFVKATIETMQYARKNKDATIKSMAKTLKMDDVAALEEAYDYFAVQTAQKVPLVNLEAVQSVVNFYKEQDIQAKVTDAKQMVDNSFVEKLDKSGFIKQIYGE